MTITIPGTSLVVLIGPSSSGKSTFADRNFLTTEIISSDVCRALVGDDENAREVNREAFGLLHHIVAARLRLGRLAVVDATNLLAGPRRAFVTMARPRDTPVVAIVFDVALPVLEQRSVRRTDRHVPLDVIREQRVQLDQVLALLPEEGFGAVHVMRSADDAGSLVVERHHQRPAQ